MRLKPSDPEASFYNKMMLSAIEFAFVCNSFSMTDYITVKNLIYFNKSIAFLHLSKQNLFSRKIMQRFDFTNIFKNKSSKIICETQKLHSDRKRLF